MTIETKNLVPPFSAQHLEAICRVWADTEAGLTGSEIGYLLRDSRIEDTDPTLTKWKRLFNAFVHFQNEHQAGNGVIVFITRSMNPASYTDRPDVFRLRRDK
ncbi:MAG: TIGR02391 family protein, partial [bacterium]